MNGSRSFLEYISLKNNGFVTNLYFSFDFGWENLIKFRMVSLYMIMEELPPLIEMYGIWVATVP